MRGSEIDANAQAALKSNVYGPEHSLPNIEDLLTKHGKKVLDEIEAKYKYTTSKTSRKQRTIETEHEVSEDVLDPTVDVNTLNSMASENERLFALLFC